MQLNKIIFPAPEPSMTLDFFKQNYDSAVKEQLIFVNAPDKKTKKTLYQIPCIYLDINS